MNAQDEPPCGCPHVPGYPPAYHVPSCVVGNAQMRELGEAEPEARIMNVQDANGCTPTRDESPLERRHRKLLEAIKRVKPIVECYGAGRVRTLGPEDMCSDARLTYVDKAGVEYDLGPLSEAPTASDLTPVIARG